MFVGENSSLVALIDAVKERVENVKENTLRSFALLCSKAYRLERRTIVETKILAKYDIDSYADYLGLKNSDRTFFDAIAKEIEKTEENWHLLFCGFDKKNSPHIFVISEFGRIQYCDIEGFAAIGSGAWAAVIALSSFPFNRRMKIGEAIFAMLAAKYTAEETADGVGAETVFVVLRPSPPPEGVPGISQKSIRLFRKKWKTLPKIPKGAGQELERDLLNVEGWIAARQEQILADSTVREMNFEIPLMHCNTRN
jgi:hypothetical protein